jgi:hypothetical protein
LKALEMIFYGALFLFGGLFAASTVGVAIGIICRKRGAPPEERPFDLKTVTDDDLRKKLLEAAANLDLWTRAATVRGMRVDAVLAQTDALSSSLPLIRPRFGIKIRNKAGEEIGAYP